jgi:pyrroline-5-carboxylate reductase
MGTALLRGWLEQGVKSTDIIVIEPFNETASIVAKSFGVNIVSGPNDISLSKNPRTIVFAIKPQSMDKSILDYKRLVATNTVFLSIAAGKTIDYFQKNLGIHAAIIRAMPNTPAAVGRGITVACKNSKTSETQMLSCEGLLQAVGTVVWIKDEGLMDAVTALSGSGPAYVFALTECMAEAGINAGLPEALAHQLARETVAGAGELLNQAPESASELCINVTSPGGTTAAALKILMAKGGLKELLKLSIEAATNRSRELAG